MPYSPGGIGSSIASGFLQGVQGAQQERQSQRMQRERDQLAMYSQLLKSGEWEPVDPRRGVPEGGVLKVGNVGMLKQVRQQPSVEQQLDLLYKKARLQNVGRQAQPFEGKQERQEVVREVDGKRVPGSVTVVWQDGQWKEKEGTFVPKVGPAPGWKTFIHRETGEIRQIGKGQQPPEGFVPYGSYSAEASRDIRERQNEASQLRDMGMTLYKKGLDMEKELAVIPAEKIEGNESLSQMQQQAKEYKDQGLYMLDRAQGIRTGKPGAGQDITALQEAQEGLQLDPQKIERLAADPDFQKDPQGWIDKAVEQFKQWGYEVGEKQYEALQRVVEKATRMLDGEAEVVAPPKVQGGEYGVVRRPMPKPPQKLIEKKKK